MDFKYLKYCWCYLFILTLTTIKAQPSSHNDVGFCFNSLPGNISNSNSAAQGMVVKDFNNDGYKDISYLSIDIGSPNLSVLKVLRNQITNTNYPSGAGAQFFPVAVNTCSNINFDTENALCGADFNSDGKVDLAVADDAGIKLFLNTTLSSASAITFSCGSTINYNQAFRFASDNFLYDVDLNNDSYIDLVVIGATGVSTGDACHIEYYKGNAGGVFTPWGNQTVNSVGLQVIDESFDCQFIDLDGDGYKDIVMNNENLSNGIIMLTSNLAGNPAVCNFPTSIISLPVFAANFYVKGFRFAKLNNDNYLDLVVNSVDFPSTIYRTLSFMNSNLSIGAPSYTMANQISTLNMPYNFILKDFNNDGSEDLIGATTAGPFNLIKGQSSGSSGFIATGNSLIWTYSSNSFMQFYCEDMDNNGYFDFITNNERDLSNTIDMVLNFSYKNTLNPSTLNLTLCAPQNLTVSTNLTMPQQGISSFAYAWILEPANNTVGTNISYSIANTGNYHSLVTGQLPYLGKACNFVSPSYTVVGGTAPNVTASTPLNTYCLGQSVNVTLNGATQYTYLVTGSTAVTTTNNAFSITPVTTGSLSIDVTGGTSGCTGNANITLTIMPNPTINVSPTSTQVCTNAPVTFIATGIGGKLPYTYVWNTSVSQASSIFTLAPASSTLVTSQIIDSEGCSSSILTSNVNVLPSPTVQIVSGQTSICSNTTSVLTFSGAANYSYNPSNGSGNSYTISPSASGAFTVTGTDLNGCTKDLVVNPVVIPTASVSIATSILTNTICPNDTIDLIASGTYSNLTWLHNNSNSSFVEISPKVPTTYTLTASLSGNLCPDVKTITIDLFPPVSDVLTASNNKICPGDSVILSTNGTNYYEWSIGGLTTATITVRPSLTTVYNVKILDNNNCKEYKSITVEVDPSCQVSVGNAVTANNDQNNDLLYIANIERHPNNVVSVYNRYGVEVFKTSGYNNTNNAWPKQEAMDKVTAGTYFYVVDLKDGKLIKGWVEVMK